jgi:transposase
MKKHPEWALKFKTKGTELRLKEGKYYLYKVTSKRKSPKERPCKITVAYLGRITEEDGLIPPRKRGENSLKKSSPALKISSISTKEYGACHVLQKISEDIISELKEEFEGQWREILVLSINRLLHQAPLKNMDFLYQESFLCEEYPDLDLSKNALTKLMKTFGREREKAVNFMKKFITKSDQLVFDITDVVSQSKNIKMAAPGYNSHHSFDPQVNLLYMFSTDTQTPVFYRIFPGNISGMKALSLSIKESGAKKAIVIGDKGFSCEENISMLENEGFDFILPLKRDSRFLDYQRLENGFSSQAFDHYFMYHGRAIFYYEIMAKPLWISICKPSQEGSLENNLENAQIYLFQNQWRLSLNHHDIQIKDEKIIKKLDKLKPLDSNNEKIKDKILMKDLKSFLAKEFKIFAHFDDERTLFVFCDRSLKHEEETSYLRRIEEGIEGYTLEGYKKKEPVFGTIGMMTNLKTGAKKVYENFKTRMEVETVFDVYKNLLEADRTYMHCDDSMNAWMLINHVAVMIYYKLLNLIKAQDLSSSISVNDLILRLSKVNKVKINNQWHLSEMPSKLTKLLTSLKLCIT